MSRTHVSLVKPVSTDDQVYAWTRDRLRRGAEQLRRWVLFEVEPGVEPLSNLVEHYQDLHSQPPDVDGLLEVPEAISFADVASAHQAMQLLLFDTTYRGTTAADLLEAVARANGCVSVNFSADRREVILGIAQPVTVCATGSAVCKGLPCPARTRKSRK